MSRPDAYVISHDRFAEVLGRIMAEKPVMGPVQRPDQPGFFLFDWMKTPADFQPDYKPTTLPPKKAFFPPEERLFSFTLEDQPRLEMIHDGSPFALVGVHPCDLAAISALDRAYSDPPAEVRWRHNRQRAVIVGLDCLPDEYCFCRSTGDADARGPSDLFLTPMDGGYLMEVHSQAGADLIAGDDPPAPGEDDLARAEAFRRRKKDGFTAQLNGAPDEIAAALEAGGLADVWEETADRCYSCGSCNTTCPTCFCFTMDDDFAWDLQSGERRRAWDSCQLLEFAAVAGGHRFREERWQRVRHRWHRKFLHLHRRFGRPFCTGCGRCSRACTADINILDETNRIIETGAKGGGRA
jgi:ferredoxin